MPKNDKLLDLKVLAQFHGTQDELEEAMMPLGPHCCF
jgi:hypothetical protein